MKVILASPRGFCAGVDRAVEIVENAISRFGAPIYVRHEVVHNRFVVQRLKNLGAVFVDELEEVPDNATVIFSAHGVSRAVWDEAERRQLQVFDATCPLVTKVHKEVIRYRNQGKEVVLIGHQGHPEVEGTLGQVDDGVYLVETEDDVTQINPRHGDSLAYVTQTTLSVDDTRKVVDRLRVRFPDIVDPKKDDICYATQNRQDAVKRLATECDLVLVVGSPNSSNSNRLREVAESQGTVAYQIDGPEDIRTDWLEDVSNIGVTAGASAPEVLVQDVIAHLQQAGADEIVEQEGEAENVVFPLPRPLRSDRVN